MKQFDLDLASSTKPLSHYWELCVGSGHATTALREDYRQQLARCHNELGFQYVRFHGLFDDDMSVLTMPRLGGEPVLSFTNVDSIFDFLLSIEDSGEGTLACVALVPAEDLETLPADGFVCRDSRKIGECLVDFQYIGVAINQAHRRRSGLKDLIEFGMCELEGALEILALGNVLANTEVAF